MADPLKFAMVFTADASAVKTATQDVRAEVEAVSGEATKAAAALDKHSAALDRDAAAATKAAAAARDQAKATKEVRDAASQATITKPATIAPAATPVAPGTLPTTAPIPSTPKVPPTPGNDNLDALRSRYAPLIAAQQSYEKQLEDISKLEAAGALSTNQLAEAKARSKKSYDEEVESIKRLTPLLDGQTRSIKLSSYERSLMNRNISDTAQGLALGMPIQQVLLQQGPQIVDIYGGIGNAAKAAAGFISVGTIAVAATVAAFALGGKALGDYLESSKEVATAANGLGRAVAGSSSGMEAAARAGAAAAGISVTAARSMETQFLRTGKIGSENYAQLIGLSKNFAATMGIDAKDAGSALADLFSDPAAGAQKLYQTYGLIDGKTASYIQHLAAQNRLSEAQAVLAKALPSQLASAAESTNAFARAWDAVATAASNAYDTIGKGLNDAISGKSGQERIDEIRQIMANPRFRDNGQQAELEKLLAQQANEEQKRQAAAANQKGAVAAGIAAQSPANTTALQIQSTRDSIAALQSGLNAPNQAPEVATQINEAIKAKTALLEGLEHQQQRLAAIDRLDIQIQSEKNPLLKAQLTEQREKISLTLQEGNTTAASLQAQRAGNAVINGAIAAGAAQADDMKAEIEIRTKLNAQVAAGTLTSSDADAELQKELALRPLVLAAATAEAQGKTELSKQLLETIKQLSAGYDGLAASQKQAAAIDFIKGQTDSLASLKAQRSLLGESDATQARAMAQLTAEQKIRDMGLSTSSAEAKAIRTNATAMADMNSQLDKAKDAWSTYKSAGSDAIDTIFDGLAAGDKISDIGKNLASSISKAALQLGVENPLKNALFGTNLGTFSDLFSGKSSALSSVAAQTVGSMNVTAATVVVNGGVTGGLGGVATGAGSLLAANSNLTGSMGQYASAIKAIESGGDYSQLGPVTASGDRAYGAYQVMGANIPSWTKATLGSSISSDQFLASPAAQDAVFSKYFGASVGKYGNPQDAASTWFTGRPLAQGAGASDILGTTGSSYVNKFNAQLAKSTTGVEGLTTASTSASKGVDGLGGATGTAAKGLNTLGGGLGKFGETLASAKSGGNSGLASLLGSLTSYGQSVFNSSSQFASAIAAGGIGLYDGGGYTGPGGVYEPRGVVHAGEVVWSQQNVADAGGVHVVEAMRLGKRGYADGGAVDVGVSPLARVGAANSNQAPAVNVLFNVQNKNGSSVDVKRKDTAQGVSLEVVVDDAVSKNINTPGSKSRRAMTGQFGLSGALAKR